jgi:hypothetical protein
MLEVVDGHVHGKGIQRQYRFHIKAIAHGIDAVEII